MIKVLLIFGTRPEVIKMAPVIRAMAARPERFEPVVCSAGQHREMLRQLVDEFELKLDIDFDLMTKNQSLSDITSALFHQLDRAVGAVSPDWILAQGDTTTVLVASLVSYYHRTKFGHVEAGLRTGDRFRPFPEEINRVVADHVGDLLFAPTENNKQALLREGLSEKRVRVTGNTVIDALLHVVQKPYDWNASPLDRIDPGRDVVTITSHRRESFGEVFRNMCLTLKALAESFSATEFVYPVHLNPNIRQPAREILGDTPNMHLLEPLDYRSMINLMKRSRLILTDSGGIQEEAPSLNVPVLVMRDKTERPEGVEAGVAKLVGTTRKNILREVESLLTDTEAHAAMAQSANPFGDGRAAERIVNALLEP